MVAVGRDAHLGVETYSGRHVLSSSEEVRILLDGWYWSPTFHEYALG